MTYDDIPKFDQYGNLPPGCYNVDPKNFKTKFVDEFNDSTKRQHIFDGYKEHSVRVVRTNSLIRQWVDGSFTTSETDPGDIDLFTIFDGLKLTDDELVEEVEQLIDQDLMKERYTCHGFGVCKYPEDMGILHDVYKKKRDFFLDYWRTDKQMMKKYNIKIEKGVIEFNHTDLDEIRGL